MKLLDLFCGAGGAAMGYYQAGFTDITGVDIKLQKRYPFKFVQEDALEYLAKFGAEYDVIHASPPCQAHSVLNHMHKKVYPQLIEPTRKLLKQLDKPYIIENVVGAPLINPITLCGTMFGLKVIRHRLFECNPIIWFAPFACAHDTGGTPSVGRGMSPKGFISITGVGGFGIPDGFNYACKAIDIDWMSRPELSQAIPPAYTKWIGEQLLKQLSF